MFERYTEKARRAIFFARYEASHFGSTEITTEHLLLGILRDDKALTRQVLLHLDYESAHREIEARVKPGEVKLPVSADLPLSDEAALALSYAAEEADRVSSRTIGTEHLLLALMRDEEFPSAKLLAQFAALDSLRNRVRRLPGRALAQGSVASYGRAPLPPPKPPPNTLEIHGRKRNLEEVRNLVNRLKSQPYYWERKPWQTRDVVWERNGKRFSFDTSLARDEAQFLVVKAGWTKDYCAVCGWELLETDDAAHATGYTNGRDWLCEECHRRFIAGNYFGSAYSDIT